MQMQVHYQNLEKSPWINQFIGKRVSKITRYLSSAASVHVHLKLEKGAYITNLVIHNKLHDYAFIGVGENLYESFSLSISKATRALAEHKRQVKDRIHRKFFKMSDEQVV